MKKGLLVLFLLITSWAAQAQDKREQIESARVAFISQRLNLTQAQAEKFWPLYNEFSNKRTELRLATKKLQSASQDKAISEETIKANLYTMTGYKQKELDLEKEYLGRFLLVLSAKQVVELQKAEKDFIKTMLDKLSND